jgi:hypothetical protein
MSIFGCNNQNIIKEPSSLSELQEQCGKRSSEFFNKEYDNGTVKTKDGTTTTQFTHHYNKKQNKCFLLLKSTHIFNDKKKGHRYLENLLDINENKEYGYFIENVKSIVCFVLDKECKSEQEWESLVKPYMED